MSRHRSVTAHYIRPKIAEPNRMLRGDRRGKREYGSESELIVLPATVRKCGGGCDEPHAQGR